MGERLTKVEEIIKKYETKQKELENQYDNKDLKDKIAEIDKKLRPSEMHIQRHEEELKAGVDAINNLVEFCGNENFYPTWNIYLYYEGHRIYPYEQSNVSNEEALNKSLEKFHSFTNELQ